MKSKIIKRLHWVMANVARLVLSCAFIFSGIVKVIDPRGTEYKIQDYGEAFGLSSLLPMYVPLFLAVALALLEFSLGIHMLFGIRRRFTSRLMVAFMAVMTPLTLYLAIANPVEDCGCFGDAWVLSNWQTFYKNIVLFLASLCTMMWYRHMSRVISERHQWTISLYSWVFGFILSGYCIYRLPVMDFRPYHIGADIREQMAYPAGKEPQYRVTYILQKGGVQQEFSIEDYPDDPSWEYVDRRDELVGGTEYVPPIHDLVITDQDGQEVTDLLLTDPGYQFWVIAPYLELADDGVMDRLAMLCDYCQEEGVPMYCFTASNEESIEDWTDRTGAEYSFMHVDATPLKTMVRSNPGLLLVHDGQVVNKWPSTALPREEELTGELATLPLAHPQMSSSRRQLLHLLLWYVLPLLAVTLIDRLWMAWKLRKVYKHKHRVLNTLKRKNMRKKIVAGNWKMNKTLQEGVALATELKDLLAAEKPNCEVIIGTPFIHLATVSELLQDSVIAVSAENCANKQSGAYTGEVSAAMVKSTGAEYVILGHSERREYYAETPEILKEKVDLALENGLKVIFCIGESLEQREANEQEAVCKAELAGSVFHLTPEQWKNIVIAYEPIWAIGTGKTATAEQAEEIHAYIRSCVAEVYGAEVADETSILYGGSCKASNAPELFAKPDIDGGLIGGASLKAPDFKGIIDAWK